MEFPIISMLRVRYEDGTYGVEVEVSGLKSEEQADAAMHHIQSLLCGQEIKSQ